MCRHCETLADPLDKAALHRVLELFVKVAERIGVVATADEIQIAFEAGGKRCNPFGPETGMRSDPGFLTNDWR